MVDSPAEIIQAYLVTQTVLNDPVNDSTLWPGYVGALPDGEGVPNNAVVLMDTTPVKDGRLMSGKTILHYGVQVLLRSKDYTTGFSKSSVILDQLEEVRRDEVTIGSVTYRLDNVSPIAGVIVLGMERETTKRRWMFSLNFQVSIT